jgi:hypothetical protein
MVHDRTGANDQLGKLQGASHGVWSASQDLSREQDGALLEDRLREALSRLPRSDLVTVADVLHDLPCAFHNLGFRPQSAIFQGPPEP